MKFSMPSAFPTDDFQAFGCVARKCFPDPLSDATLFDLQQKWQHFVLSLHAVRYRYRACAEV